MPLKSAACGRELEAGLRRRPGSNNVTFDGKPLDGVFVMHNFPCCAWSPLRTCRRQYPGRSDGTCSLVQFHSLRPSPELWAGRLLHHYFRGLLSVHSRYSLHARRVALATLCTRGFSSLVASTAALIATGWSEPVPGRVYPRCGPAPSRRTRVCR